LSSHWERPRLHFLQKTDQIVADRQVDALMVQLRELKVQVDKYEHDFIDAQKDKITLEMVSIS